MPDRKVIAEELADLFRLLGHPDRIRIIEELRKGEYDVGGLSQLLGISGSRTSQHFSLLKAYRLVEERREGRHHYYRLAQPDLAEWIIDALAFIEGRMTSVSTSAIQRVRQQWDPASDTSTTNDNIDSDEGKNHA